MLNLTLPDDQWQPSSLPNALYTSFTINNTVFHAEAWEMKLNDDGELETVNPDYQSDFDFVYQGFIRDGAPNTVEIAGRDYFVVIAP